MHSQDPLQQAVSASVKKSLTFDVLYQVIRPDISAFVAVSVKLPLKNLDDWERAIRYAISSSLQSARSSRARFNHVTMGSLRWLDICSADGFRREAALRTLSGGAPGSFLFALVVRRLNDWVPQVRKRHVTHYLYLLNIRIRRLSLMSCLPYFPAGLHGEEWGMQKKILCYTFS